MFTGVHIYLCVHAILFSWEVESLTIAILVTLSSYIKTQACHLYIIHPKCSFARLPRFYGCAIKTRWPAKQPTRSRYYRICIRCREAKTAGMSNKSSWFILLQWYVLEHSQKGRRSWVSWIHSEVFLLYRTGAFFPSAISYSVSLSITVLLNTTAPRFMREHVSIIFTYVFQCLGFCNQTRLRIYEEKLKRELTEKE